MDFVNELRRRSNYPFLRGAVRLLMMAGYLAAMTVAMAGLFAFTLSSAGPSSVLFGCLMLIGAVLIVLLTHVARELMIMLADIADGVLAVAQYQGESLPPRANTDWG